jgi:hypothetical protein
VIGRKSRDVPREWQVALTLQLQAAKWKVARPDRAAPEQAEWQAVDLLDVLKEHRSE